MDAVGGFFFRNEASAVKCLAPVCAWVGGERICDRRWRFGDCSVINKRKTSSVTSRTFPFFFFISREVFNWLFIWGSWMCAHKNTTRKKHSGKMLPAPTGPLSLSRRGPRDLLQRRADPAAPFWRRQHKVWGARTSVPIRLLQFNSGTKGVGARRTVQKGWTNHGWKVESMIKPVASLWRRLWNQRRTTRLHFPPIVQKKWS